MFQVRCHFIFTYSFASPTSTVLELQFMFRFVSFISLHLDFQFPIEIEFPIPFLFFVFLAFLYIPCIPSSHYLPIHSSLFDTVHLVNPMHEKNHELEDFCQCEVLHYAKEAYYPIL
eukprot:gnl/MRDRNA2_/MRDRNA2_66782_c0_seq1.p1 gnl/MRDRNA2_/MRDRNA2_66782_c0~~gnl/MRDRNA2_/MRDRNA2_66782_c0_seq1.p1  ORF type:complete len:116 (+),score=7.86 gnl/MRDRNA2_/MRDRNA2_66782_c0_seq1:258-605(+)